MINCPVLFQFDEQTAKTIRKTEPLACTQKIYGDLCIFIFYLLPMALAY